MLAPLVVWMAGRGWSVGSSNVPRPLSCRFQYRQLILQHLPLQPLPLPDSEIGILNGQRRQRRGLSSAERRTERTKLTEEHDERPSIGDDVMNRQEKNMVALGHPQQRHAQQRTGREIERAAGLLDGQPLRFRLCLRFGVSPKVGDRQRHRQRRSNHLHRLPGDHLERGAQRFMPRHQLVEAAGEHRCIQRAAKADGIVVVVERVARQELVEKPQPLLREREGRGTRRRPPGDCPAPGDVALAAEQPFEHLATLRRQLGRCVARARQHRGTAPVPRQPPCIVDILRSRYGFTACRTILNSGPCGVRVVVHATVRNFARIP